MDAISKEGIYNQDIIKAVQWLYGQGIIRRDKDIIDKTRYGKSTVSGYITGKIKASEEFRKKFEEVFELNLSDFSNGIEMRTEGQLPVGNFKITLDDYIHELRNDKRELQEQLKTNLTAMMQLLAALSRHDRAFHETILRSLAHLEGGTVDLVAEARSFEAAKQVEEMTGSSMTDKGS